VARSLLNTTSNVDRVLHCTCELIQIFIGEALEAAAAAMMRDSSAAMYRTQNDRTAPAFRSVPPNRYLLAKGPAEENQGVENCGLE